eukprot:scpid50084/ scgid15265/ tRNA wybutosine-synthesizing protein 3 homolog; tRNA-yW-synthesizing protein 3
MDAWAFARAKEQCLSQVDRSKKGSIDEPVAEVVDTLNASDHFFTTSSCSGRVAIFWQGEELLQTWAVELIAASVPTLDVRRSIYADISIIVCACREGWLSLIQLFSNACFHALCRPLPEREKGRGDKQRTTAYYSMRM